MFLQALQILAPIVGGLATIIAALIAVFGGQYVYRKQRDIDYAQELKRDRRKVYSEFMRSLVGAVSGDSTPHLTARIEAAQIGSVGVIRALARYNAYCARTNPGGEKRDARVFRQLLAHVLIEMRKEVFDDESMDPSDYADLLPIS